MLQKALDIAGEILAPNPGVKPDDLRNDWHQVVLFHVVRSRQALAGVRCLATEQLYSPAVVLSRHLFELGVNLRYLKNDPLTRVPKYLRHYRVPVGAQGREEKDQTLRSLREQEDHVGISKLLVAGGSWVSLKEMCDELGCLDQYETMYRGASELAHGGALGLGQEMVALVTGQPRPEHEIPPILLTALIYHHWVVEVCCEVFPYLDMARDFRFDPSWFEKYRGLEKEILEATQAYLEQLRSDGPS